jgi:hypothetical protein
MKNYSRLLPIALLLLLFPILTLLASRSYITFAAVSTVAKNINFTFEPASNNETIANCRYGAASDIPGEQTEIIPQLGAGWYLTFHTYPPAPPPSNGADFAHMLGVNQVKDGCVYKPEYKISPALNGTFADYIRNNPGDLWIVGNEVDRGPNPDEDPTKCEPVQGDTYPEIYAKAYHDAYTFIKSNDPTAQVGNSGLVEITPGRLQYLDTVWDTYLQEYGMPMQVDAWIMHLYVLPELQSDGQPNGIANVALGSDATIGKRGSGGNPQACSDPDVYCFAEHDNLSVFAEQVRDMRTWMAQHGQRQKPLLITEYSILYPYVLEGGLCEFLIDENGECFTPTRVSEFMTATFDYLNSATDPTLGYSLDNNRLVQQWLWFAINYTGAGGSSNLVESDLTTFTMTGNTFKNYVLNEARYQNLLIDNVKNVVVRSGSDGTATADISATFRNNGNTKINLPFTVTFYKDAALTMPIDSVIISSDVLGCTSRSYATAVQWAGLTEGLHKYWVHVDSENVIVELPPDNSDNIGSGKVLVVSDQVLLPTVQRR